MAWLLWLLLIPLAIVVTIEMGVFSVRAERLESAVQAGDKRAKIILDYLANPPLFLACIQIYSTVIGLAMGALSTPYLASPLAGWLRGFGLATSVVEPLATTLSLSVVTLATLLFANLLPKQLGFAHAEEVVLKTARLSQVMLLLVRPLAVALEWLTKVLARALGIQIVSQSPVTESDLQILLAQGRKEGHLDARESGIVERAFRLSDIALRDVMTPRETLEWINLRDDLVGLRERALHLEHSFVPVCEGSLDDCVGILKARDLLGAELSRESIRALLAEPLRVPPSARVLDLVDLLKGHKARLALVTDEHARVLGAVSLNDVVEAVLGEMRSLEA